MCSRYPVSALVAVLDEVRVNKSVTSVDYAKAEYLVATQDVTKFGEPQSDTPAVDVLPQGVTVY